MNATQMRTLYTNAWNNWAPFPDPQNKGVICAPFGPGVYQLRNKKTNQFVLFGMGKNVAFRMTSLLPSPLGAGVRLNYCKRQYVSGNLSDIEYRTMALDDVADAKSFEQFIKTQENYIFKS